MSRCEIYHRIHLVDLDLSRLCASRHVSFVAALQLFRVFSSCDYMAAAKMHHCYLGQVAILGVRYCLIPDRCETFSFLCGKISCYLPLA